MSNPRTLEYPKIASRAEWLNARKELLAKEKELTRHRDAVNAARNMHRQPPRQQRRRS
jgi:predicted dithiol-disulfide oxidoreductase (DUF899 family)